MKINYKSDFDFLLRLRDITGKEIGWPEFDWRARFYTSTKANVFEASCIGDERRNCFNDDGRIHIVADNHHLSAGELHCEFTSYFPNDEYADGNERIVTPFDLDITLVRDSSGCPSEAVAEAMLPSYVRDRAANPGVAKVITFVCDSGRRIEIPIAATEGGVQSPAYYYQFSTEDGGIGQWDDVSEDYLYDEQGEFIGEWSIEESVQPTAAEAVEI